MIIVINMFVDKKNQHLGIITLKSISRIERYTMIQGVTVISHEMDDSRLIRSNSFRYFVTLLLLLVTQTTSLKKKSNSNDRNPTCFVLNFSFNHNHLSILFLYIYIDFKDEIQQMTRPFLGNTSFKPLSSKETRNSQFQMQFLLLVHT